MFLSTHQNYNLWTYIRYFGGEIISIELLKVIKSGNAKVFLTGYAHIDSEWLWSLRETTEICRSTFKNVLDIMERFKDIVFELGPVLCYELIEAEEPKPLEKIIDKVKEGRWRIAGAPFLEFDSYMPSGEFIVRHLLYGRKYFKKYGIDIEPVLFLPDSFGFPLTLSKILRGFNIRFFVTYKLKWNDTNEVKYNIFYWGTNPRESVLAYILPGNYNDYLSDIKRILWNLYKQYTKQRIPTILVVYGRGDHGGGPEEDEAKNLEYWKRPYPFLKLTFSGMEEFFKYIEHTYSDNLPLLNDELYLEFHRGVYTTGTTAKKLNRINEYLALQVEKLYTMLMTLYDYEYPHEDINVLLRKILINQGHDSLPSTVTPEVYIDIVNRGFRTFRSLLKIMRNGLRKLCERVGSKYLVFNPNSQNISIYIRINGDIKGHCQHMNDGTRLCYIENLPSLGYITFNSIKIYLEI